MIKIRQFNEKHFMEKSLFDFSMKDIITKNYIKDVELSDSYDQFAIGFQYEYTYTLYDEESEEINLQDLDEKEIQELSEFKEWFLETLEEKYNDIESLLKDTINDDLTITLYRALDVREDWFEHLQKEGKHLGIYWTWDKDCAEAHWGKSDIANKFKKKTIGAVLISEIDEKHVDWLDTFRLNLDASLGDMEREIRLFKNTPLRIINLVIDDKEIDISLIKDKIFYA